MVKQPADPVTLRAEEGEGLMAHVHQRNVPAAVAERLEQIIRTGFWLVLALQETQMTVQRLRRLLYGGIHTKRDSQASVRYAERVNSRKSSISLQRTDR